MKKQNYLVLFVLMFSTPSFAQEEMASSQPVGKSLRKREHNVSVEYTSVSTKSKPYLGTEVEASNGRMSVTYGYEFGYFQIGVGGASTVEKSGSSEFTTGSFALSVRGSFIRNEPGNDLIPFGFLSVGGIAGKSKTSSSDVETRGHSSEIGVGLDWYPFGELFAFRTVLSGVSAEVKGSNGSTIASGTATGSGLAIGSVLSF